MPIHSHLRTDKLLKSMRKVIHVEASKGEYFLHIHRSDTHAEIRHPYKIILP